MRNRKNKSKKSTETAKDSGKYVQSIKFDVNEFWKHFFQNSDKLSVLVKRTLFGLALILAVSKEHYVITAFTAGSQSLFDKIVVGRAP